MRRTDDRAVEALLNAIADWFSGSPMEDGLGYTPDSVEGLRRRFAERMAALGRGRTGGGDSSKTAAITPTGRPPAS